MKTEILGNDISWYVDSKKIIELDDETTEYLENMIKEGYTRCIRCVC